MSSTWANRSIECTGSVAIDARASLSVHPTVPSEQVLPVGETLAAVRSPHERASRIPAAAAATHDHRGPGQEPAPASRHVGGGVGAALHRPHRRRGPSRVAVAQGRVVVLVDVAGVVLTLEVGQRAQQELALVLELGESVSVHRPPSRARRRRTTRRAAPLRPARGRRRWARCRACGFQRRKARASPAMASTSTAAGSAHTKASNPVALGEQQDRRRLHGVDQGDDLAVAGVAGRHLAGDLDADASAAEARDSNTLSPSQVGQASRLLIESTRSSASTARCRGWRRSPTGRRPRRRAGPTPASASTPGRSSVARLQLAELPG